MNEPPQLADSPFVLLTVCRIVPVKSIITQVRAVKCLHESGRRDVRLMIVGDGTDRGRIEAEATRLGVEESVSFEGHQPCPRSFHRRAHVFLSTSYNETFGMTLAEAMSDGMICIAASAGGPSELIDHGNSGFLVPCTESVPRELRGRMPKGQALPTVVYDASLGGLRPVAGVDPAVLANQIAQVRARYNELSTMRLAAQERIRRHFSLEHYCQSLEGVYDGLT